MGFPATRQTLIHRIVENGAEADWEQLVSDYWEPLVRFARSRGVKTDEAAEDIVSETFEAVLRGDLLRRWLADPRAKLRTLLCTVVRQVLANQARVERGRTRLLRGQAHELRRRDDLPTLLAPYVTAEDGAAEAAWVQGMLFQVVESLLAEYHSTGRGDAFRVLHGRICLRMTAPQIAEALGIPVGRTESHYRAARARLATKLRKHIRDHVRRYCPPEKHEEEFAAEWASIGQYLLDHGGLEEAIAAVYARGADGDGQAGTQNPPRR